MQEENPVFRSLSNTLLLNTLPYLVSTLFLEPLFGHSRTQPDILSSVCVISRAAVLSGEMWSWREVLHGSLFSLSLAKAP